MPTYDVTGDPVRITFYIADGGDDQPLHAEVNVTSIKNSDSVFPRNPDRAVTASQQHLSDGIVAVRMKTDCGAAVTLPSSVSNSNIISP